MAVLTAAELETARGRMAALHQPVWTKAQCNAAQQAIEDAMVSTAQVGARSVRNYLLTAIETAAPGVFTNAHKDSLFLVWTQCNADRGGIV